MNIEMNAELFNIIPTLKLGINHYTKITVSESPQMLKGRLQLFQEQLYFELDQKPFSNFPGIQAWRETWIAFGADPAQAQPSVEKLYSSIKKQEYLQSVHTAVDLNTFFSLQYEIPISIYDVGKTVGDIQLTLGKENDRYDGLNGQSNALRDILLLKDDYSPFGSPFVDSMRTPVTVDTNEAIQVFFLNPSMEVEEALKLTQASGNMFTSISGGETTSYVLHKDQSTITLNR